MEETSNTEGIDQDRVHIKNIPLFLGFKQFKKLLEKVLQDVKPKKVRHMSDYAYVTFETPEDAKKAIGLVEGYEIKKQKLKAKLAATEVKNFRAEDSKPEIRKTVRETVTPLADQPYENQLDMKQANCQKTVNRLFQQLKENRVANLTKQGEFQKLLQKVTPSPKITSYRNKCEFTIGHDLDGQVCVGFVGGKFAKNQHFVLKPEGVDIISDQMRAIVKDVEEFVKESQLEPFNEFERKGFWRMLSIREFGGDVMLIFTVYPFENEKENEEKEKLLKEAICKRFIDPSTLTDKKYRICSIYWQKMIHCSDVPNFELIGGTPYIYESLLDCRFRVSPPAFFQTNSQAAAVLYSTIGEVCGLREGEQVNQQKGEQQQQEATETEIPAKRAKIEGNENNGVVLLDICCGTGTIGQCLLKNLHKEQKICCIGVEMIAEAVEDAKQNAKQNKMENCCKYIAGKAEDVFRSMKYHLPTGFDFRTSKLVGVLDPPRAGIHEKVILACREMETMKRMIFVSCEPNAAMKNIVDLCRPTSRKFGGDPFSITKIQPVDMFPQTSHVEWIIQLDR